VIVDEVHCNDQIGNFGVTILYDPAVVRIVSKDFNSFMLPGGFELVPQSLPDQDGSYRVDAGQIGITGPCGEAVLVRLGVECVTDGTSVIDANDIGAGIQDGIPDLKKPTGQILPVTMAVDGQIICGSGAVPTPTASPTASPSPTPASTTPTGPTPTVTMTPTGGVVTQTPTQTATQTATPTQTATATATVTPTVTPTETATQGPTVTATVTPTVTPTGTVSGETGTATGTAAGGTSPAGFPPTGGSSGDGSTISWLLLILAGVLITGLGLSIGAVVRSRSWDS
jgi:hypothetical protein